MIHSKIKTRHVLGWLGVIKLWKPVLNWYSEPNGELKVIGSFKKSLKRGCSRLAKVCVGSRIRTSNHILLTEVFRKCLVKYEEFAAEKIA